MIKRKRIEKDKSIESLTSQEVEFLIVRSPRDFCKIFIYYFTHKFITLDTDLLL